MSGSKLDKLGFGAWQLGGVNVIGGVNKGWQHIDTEAALELLDSAYSLGIRFFDTAGSYGRGRSERLLGEAFRDKSDIIICTKFGTRSVDGKIIKDFSVDNLRRSLEASLEALGLEKVHYLLLHGPDPGSVTEEILLSLEEVKAEGLIGASGISVTLLEPHLEWISAFEAIEILYNPLMLRNVDLIPMLQDKRIFIRSIFASGILLKDASFFENREDLVDWRAGLPEELFAAAAGFVRSHPDRSHRYSTILKGALDLEVDKVIIGMSRIGHLEALKRYLKIRTDQHDQDE